MSIKITAYFLAILVFFATYTSNIHAASYYVAPSGSDSNQGTENSPFKTIQKAFDVVSARVLAGTYSDNIYLKKGIYYLPDRNFRSLPGTERWTYRINMRGTAQNPSLFSAMPCDNQNDDYKQANCVQRKSGKWYEEVVIHGGQELHKYTTWQKHSDKVWKISGIYTNSTDWVWNQSSPKNSSDSLGPRMILQDGKALIWVESPNLITEPGQRAYDRNSRTLYIRLYEDKSPTSVRLESLRGDDLQNFQKDIFQGNLLYTTFEGIEFRLIRGLFPLPRWNWGRYPGLQDENGVKYVTKHVTISDNFFNGMFNTIQTSIAENYVGTGDVLDVNQHAGAGMGYSYDSNSHWHAVNNVWKYPIAEIFQVSGEGNIFEKNEVIEAGVDAYKGGLYNAAYVWMSDSKNMKVRYNLFRGSLTEKHKYSDYSICYEDYAGWQKTDGSKVCVAGDHEIYGNLFLNVGNSDSDNIYNKSAHDTPDLNAIIADVHGGCIKDNLNIHDNIFYNVHPEKATSALYLRSPLYDSSIKNNLFYNVKIAGITTTAHQIAFNSYPSRNFTISNNTFEGCAPFSGNALDQVILQPNLAVGVTTNMFGSGCNVQGQGVTGNPIYNDKNTFDFRYKASSPNLSTNSGLTNYTISSSIPGFMQWWAVIQGSAPVDPEPTPVSSTPTPTVTPKYDSNFDVNQDTKIDIKDIMDLLKFIFQ